MQGAKVIFFKENGASYRGVVIHYDRQERQVVVQDDRGGEWVGKPEQVFKCETEKVLSKEGHCEDRAENY